MREIKELKTTVVSTREGRLVMAAFLIPGLLAGVVYFLTAAPGLSWRFGGEDGGDLITAATLGSVPHPTGYPLYMILSRIFLPLSPDPARALNLASAFWGAVGCGLVSLAAARFYYTLLNISRGLSTSVGITVGLALAFAPLVWSQALITEVYSLNLALTALFLLTLFYWHRGTKASGELVALVGGLAVGHHRTALFTVVAGLLFILLNQRALPGLKKSLLYLLRVLPLFLLGLFGPYLYFLIRTGSFPPPNWYSVGEWNLPNFWSLFSATDYQPYVLGVPFSQIPSQLSASAKFLVEQFGWPGLIIGWYGFTLLWQKSPTRPFAALLTTSFILNLGFAITYNGINSQIYLIPAFLMWGLAGGVGIVNLLELLGEKLGQQQIKAVWVKFAAFVVVIALIMTSLALNYSNMDLSRDKEAVEWLNTELDLAPNGAVLVSGDDNVTFTLWYGLYVQKRRPDLVVVDSRLLGFNWYRINLNHLYPELALSPAENGLEVTRLSLQKLNSQRPVILVTAQK